MLLEDIVYVRRGRLTDCPVQLGALHPLLNIWSVRDFHQRARISCSRSREYASDPTVLQVRGEDAKSTLYLIGHCSNRKQKSLYGFRASTLLGWLGGDAYKWAKFAVLYGLIAHPRLQGCLFLFTKLALTV